MRPQVRCGWHIHYGGGDLGISNNDLIKVLTTLRFAASIVHNNLLIFRDQTLRWFLINRLCCSAFLMVSFVFRFTFHLNIFTILHKATLDPATPKIIHTYPLLGAATPWLALWCIRSPEPLYSKRSFLWW